MKIRIYLSIFFLLLISKFAFGQLEGIDPEYLETLKGRSEKIVQQLELMDARQEARVQEIIVIQYYQLSLIHDARDEAMAKIGNLSGTEKEDAKKAIQDESEARLYKLHAAYLASLSAELSQDQVEKVKDGMTYGVLRHTYRGYLNLLPDLTDDQKRYIYKNLVEAREYAMDAGSSKEKHGWFGKYKGRINNYLSAEGYDLKQAEEKLNSRDEEHTKE
mgnify:CR=1 FL=1